MIKRILLYLMLIPGMFSILLVAVSNRLALQMNSEAIELVTKYAVELQGLGGATGMMSSDMGLMFIMYQINKYSHLIITICVIYIMIIIYLLTISRRNKNEKRKKI